MVLGGEQRADVAVQHEVGLDGPLDRLLDLGIGVVDEVPDPAADVAAATRAGRRCRRRPAGPSHTAPDILLSKASTVIIYQRLIEQSKARGVASRPLDVVNCPFHLDWRLL